MNNEDLLATIVRNREFGEVGLVRAKTEKERFVWAGLRSSEAGLRPRGPWSVV